MPCRPAAVPRPRWASSASWSGRAPAPSSRRPATSGPGAALDKIAGTEWRVAARVASVAAGAAREVLRDQDAVDADAGEPLAAETPVRPPD